MPTATKKKYDCLVGSIGENFNFKGKMFVNIGAMRFPVIGVGRQNADEINLSLDFVGANEPQPQGAIGQGVTAKRNSGLWMRDILNLIDQNKQSDPVVVLSVKGVESHTSRVTHVHREDNPVNDGPGGTLYLHVDSDLVKSSEDVNVTMNEAEAGLIKLALDYALKNQKQFNGTYGELYSKQEINKVSRLVNKALGNS